VNLLLVTVFSLVPLGAAHADEPPQTIPSSVVGDPAPDPANPPRSAQVLVPSHGLGMNGLFYLVIE